MCHSQDRSPTVKSLTIIALGSRKTRTDNHRDKCLRCSVQIHSKATNLHFLLENVYKRKEKKKKSVCEENKLLVIKLNDKRQHDRLKRLKMIKAIKTNRKKADMSVPSSMAFCMRPSDVNILQKAATKEAMMGRVKLYLKLCFVPSVSPDCLYNKFVAFCYKLLFSLIICSFYCPHFS